MNVSDWFASSPLATPANFGDLQRVRSGTWRQLREHVPKLRGIAEPPPFIPDRAVSEMASRPDLAAHPKQPLTNRERLLVNVAGSWHRRPSAQTAFGNLVIAGDYVRTSTDFASMEAANEAAKRAVNVILARDHREQGNTDVYPSLPEQLQRLANSRQDYCRVKQNLPVPSELSGLIKVVAALDRPCMKLGLRHPLMLIPTPIGWFAGLEARLRTDSPRSSWPAAGPASAPSLAVRDGKRPARPDGRARHPAGGRPRRPRTLSRRHWADEATSLGASPFSDTRCRRRAGRDRRGSR